MMSHGCMLLGVEKKKGLFFTFFLSLCMNSRKPYFPQLFSSGFPLRRSHTGLVSGSWEAAIAIEKSCLIALVLTQSKLQVILAHFPPGGKAWAQFTPTWCHDGMTKASLCWVKPIKGRLQVPKRGMNLCLGVCFLKFWPTELGLN